MVLVFGDVESLDHRCTDGAQLIHDDRVPLLPADRQLRPRRSLSISDRITARHRPSRGRLSPDCLDRNTLTRPEQARTNRVAMVRSQFPMRSALIWMRFAALQSKVPFFFGWTRTNSPWRNWT